MIYFVTARDLNMVKIGYSVDPHLRMGMEDASVEVSVLPTFAGLGSGGTGDDDPGKMSFSRDLIERELRVSPNALLAMVAEGNSMEPEFFGGDVMSPGRAQPQAPVPLTYEQFLQFQEQLKSGNKPMPKLNQLPQRQPSSVFAYPDPYGSLGF